MQTFWSEKYISRKLCTSHNHALRTPHSGIEGEFVQKIPAISPTLRGQTVGKTKAICLLCFTVRSCNPPRFSPKILNPGIRPALRGRCKSKNPVYFPRYPPPRRKGIPNCRTVGGEGIFQIFMKKKKKKKYMILKFFQNSTNLETIILFFFSTH